MDDPLSRLTVLLPPGEDPPSAVSASERETLAVQWKRARELGFELELRPGSLRVTHGAAGFRCVVRLSRPDDLGERRRLFAELRRAFGGPIDRRLPWLFRPGPSVTSPYESLKAILTVCEAVRGRGRAAAPAP